MFCLQVCVCLRVFACVGDVWAILRVSANVLRTSSRGSACVYMFWRPLGYSACVCACSAYKFASFACFVRVFGVRRAILCEFLYVLRTNSRGFCMILRVGVLRPLGYVA